MTRTDQFDPLRGTIAAWLCGVARNLARKAYNGRREDATDPARISPTTAASRARTSTRHAARAVC